MNNIWALIIVTGVVLLWSALMFIAGMGVHKSLVASSKKTPYFDSRLLGKARVCTSKTLFRSFKEERVFEVVCWTLFGGKDGAAHVTVKENGESLFSFSRKDAVPEQLLYETINYLSAHHQIQFVMILKQDYEIANGPLSHCLTKLEVDTAVYPAWTAEEELCWGDSETKVTINHRGNLTIELSANPDNDALYDYIVDLIELKSWQYDEVDKLGRITIACPPNPPPHVVWPILEKAAEVTVEKTQYSRREEASAETAETA